MTTRPSITEADVDRVLADLRSAYLHALRMKGPGIFVSSHEIVGIIDEEFSELRAAAHQVKSTTLKNHKTFADVARQCGGSPSSPIRGELLDIAIAAVHGLASVDSGQMDW